MPPDLLSGDSGRLAVTGGSTEPFVVRFGSDDRLEDLAGVSEGAAAERPSLGQPGVDGVGKLGRVLCREQLILVNLAHRDPQCLFQPYPRIWLNVNLNNSSPLPHRCIKRTPFPRNILDTNA